ncbi:hypothetical protein Tco_0492259 [Tanacetum coccineum]
MALAKDLFLLMHSISQKFQADTRVYASTSSSKKLRKAKEPQKAVNPQLVEGLPDEPNRIEDKSAATDSNSNLESRASVAIALRSSVLQACTVTSGFIALAGVVIRQGSNFASSQGWPIADFSSEISFDFEIWHLQLIAGLVILVSSSRFLLLKTWSDFAESSEASNQLFASNYDVFLMDDESNETIVCEVNEYRLTPGISTSGKKSAINALSILEWNGADKLVVQIRSYGYL